MRAMKILPLVLSFALISLVHAEPNLVSRWKLEEGFGSDVLDPNGNKNHVTLYGDPFGPEWDKTYYRRIYEANNEKIDSQEACYEFMPDYNEWVAVGMPACWCYPRQCHGDADGLAQGSAKTGYMYCYTDDLDIMSAGWGKKDPPKGSGIIGLHVNGVPVACADFDHQRQGSAKTGYTRIYTDDLDVLSACWQVKEPPKGSGTPPDCPPGNKIP